MGGGTEVRGDEDESRTSGAATMAGLNPHKVKRDEGNGRFKVWRGLWDSCPLWPAGLSNPTLLISPPGSGRCRTAWCVPLLWFCPLRAHAERLGAPRSARSVGGGPLHSLAAGPLPHPVSFLPSRRLASLPAGFHVANVFPFTCVSLHTIARLA